MAGGAAIRIAVLANASQAKRELDSVSTKGQKFSRGLGVASKVAAGGLLALGVAAVKAGKAAAEDEAGQSRLAQALRTGAHATSSQIAQTESWITAQGKALGVSDDQLRPALAKLATATGSVAKAQKLATLGMNISAGSGKSLETVTQALAKAQSTGSVTALGKYGVATKDADGKTRSLAAITRDLGSKYQGAAAKAAETTAGKQKILTVQMGELQEQIGAKLLPVMTKLATIGLTVVNYISQHSAQAQVLIGVLAGLAAIVITVNAATKVYEAGTKLVTVATKVWAAGQWLLNAALTANPIGLVVLAIVALIAIFVLAWKNSETFRNIVIGAWNAIKAATSAVWNAVKAIIVGVFVVMKTIITTYIKVYVAIIKAAWTAIKTVTSAVWGAVKAVVSAVVGAVLAVIRTQFNAAKTVVTAAWNAVKSATTAIWNGIKTAVSNAVTGLMNIVRGIHGKITGIFSGAAGWLLSAGKHIIQGLLDGIGSMIGKVKDKLSSLTSLIPKIKGPPARDAKLLRPAGIAIIQSLMDGFDVQTPAMRRQLQGLSKEISSFSASPKATVQLSAAEVFSQVSASGSSTQSISVKLTAQQVSQIQRGRELALDLEAYQTVGTR